MFNHFMCSGNEVSYSLLDARIYASLCAPGCEDSTGPKVPAATLREINQNETLQKILNVTEVQAREEKRYDESVKVSLSVNNDPISKRAKLMNLDDLALSLPKQTVHLIQAMFSKLHSHLMLSEEPGLELKVSCFKKLQCKDSTVARVSSTVITEDGSLGRIVVMFRYVFHSGAPKHAQAFSPFCVLQLFETVHNGIHSKHIGLLLSSIALTSSFRIYPIAQVRSVQSVSHDCKEMKCTQLICNHASTKDRFILNKYIIRDEPL